MLKLDYDVAPVLPEDPDDHVRDEGHDDDEETEQPDWQRGEDDRVDSDRNTTHIISVRGNENSQKSFKFCHQMSVRSFLHPFLNILGCCFQLSRVVVYVIQSITSKYITSKI